MKKLFTLLLLLSCASLHAQHTFSIVAVDSITGEIGSAGATCGDSVIWPGTPGAKIISSVVPGKFAIHTQAWYIADNQQRAVDYMNTGKSPQQTINWLIDNDIHENPKLRQYGIVDFNGGHPRSAGYTGSDCDDYKNHITGPNYAIQGNILLGQYILDSMEAGFLRAKGSLADKLMAAMKGARIVGADSRCAANGTSSLSAFIRVAKPADAANKLYIDVNVAAVPKGQEPIDVLAKKLSVYLGIVQQQPRLSFGIFPNPAASVVSLRFAEMLPDLIILQDVAGKTVSEISKGRVQPQTDIQLNDIAPGLYIVKLFREGKMVGYDKLVVNSSF